ncbi:MAG: chemotaxis protein CheB [Luteimonas sp.]
MADPAVRVALLARPGAACDNLQAALRQAGADVVLVVDPTGSDAGSVKATSPQAVLVALEPSVEEVLDRYEQILHDPATTVIYDEVAVAARREGWDAARWSRHLAAKLGGHHDVLPPGADIEIEVPAVAPAWHSLAVDCGEISLGMDAGESDRPAQASDNIDFGGLTSEMAAVMAADPVQPEAAIVVDELPALEWESHTIDAPAPPAPVTPRPATRLLSHDEMALVDTEISQTPAITPAVDEQGAVIVLAGIGGPDAVRHFLAALRVGFARPIIVRQRLDGGRHDRLVRQMQRATSLPVELAEAGSNLADGHVYILPDGMTTTQAADVVTFIATDAAVPVLAGLPASDCAILMLSGSDVAVVPEVLAAVGAGALAVAQAPEDCFDSAAPMALIAAGGEACPPDELAQRLTTRWLSLKD